MIEIEPVQHCDAFVRLPGSKSCTHRALILSSLADGESVLLDALRSEDTGHTVRALQKFGVPIFWEGASLRVIGQGGRLRGRDETVFVGNSGTSMRFLTALSALRRGRTLLDGDERMRTRPMRELLSALEALGVRAYSEEGNGCPPVVVDSRGLKGGTVRIRGAESSQFLSALLMAAPYAEEDVCVETTNLSSRPYVEITLHMMSIFGVEAEKDGDDSFSVRSGQRYLPRKCRIEGDASHASYFFSAAAVTGGRVKIENFRRNSVQGDTGFLHILERMGCEVNSTDRWTEVRGRQLQAIQVDMNAMPDVVPTLAVAAAFGRGKTVIRNIGHLRLKESDRVGTVAQELRKMGVRVEEGKDWLAVEGGRVHGAEIDPHNDHRLAMSFAVAGLSIPGVKIRDEGCVNKSFPDFWETLKKLYIPTFRG